MADKITDAGRVQWCRDQAEKLDAAAEPTSEPHEYHVSHAIAASFLAMAAKIQKRIDRKARARQ